MINGMISQSKYEKNYLTHSFIGSSVTVYGNVGPNMGTMKVILDNETISILTQLFLLHKNYFQKEILHIRLTEFAFSRSHIPQLSSHQFRYALTS